MPKAAGVVCPVIIRSGCSHYVVVAADSWQDGRPRSETFAEVCTSATCGFGTDAPHGNWITEATYAGDAKEIDLVVIVELTEE